MHMHFWGTVTLLPQQCLYRSQKCPLLLDEECSCQKLWVWESSEVSFSKIAVGDSQVFKKGIDDAAEHLCLSRVLFPCLIFFWGEFSTLFHGGAAVWPVSEKHCAAWLFAGRYRLGFASQKMFSARKRALPNFTRKTVTRPPLPHISLKQSSAVDRCPVHLLR